jgi:hypothetical protein
MAAGRCPGSMAHLASPRWLPRAPGATHGLVAKSYQLKVASPRARSDALFPTGIRREMTDERADPP